MKNLLIKYRQVIDYLFWGAATTVVNYIAYFLMTRALQLGAVPANIVAWAVSVIFAFWVNRAFVFHGEGNPVKEFLLFTGGRVFSGVLETGMLWLFVDILHFNDGLVKILASVIVVVLNYIFSKFIIFVKRGK